MAYDDDGNEVKQGLGDAEAVIQFARRNLKAEVLTLEGPNRHGVEVAAVPKGRELVSIKKLRDEWLEVPERVRGCATLQTPTSLIDHVNRFKLSESVLFCDMDRYTLTAVIDYHRGETDDRARWCQHRAIYHFPLSDEWKAWAAVKDQWLGQATFAEFLEERLADVRDPDLAGDAVKNLTASLGFNLASPSQLRALSRGLSVHDSMKVTNAQKLESGEASFIFESEHLDGQGGKLSVPSAFIITIPVFADDVPYQLFVRLRYRLDKTRGTVNWGLILHEPDRARRDAMITAAKEAAEKTGLPLFFGAPE